MCIRDRIVIRIPIEIGDLLRKYVEDLSRQSGGLRISRAGALRVLIESGLSRAGYEVPEKRAKKAAVKPKKKATKKAARR